MTSSPTVQREVGRGDDDGSKLAYHALIGHDYFYVGDPLSPLVVNIVIIALTKMLGKTTERGLTIGLLQQFRPGVIVTL
jgi:hypothetical protein